MWRFLSFIGRGLNSQPANLCSFFNHHKPPSHFMWCFAIRQSQLPFHIHIKMLHVSPMLRSYFQHGSWCRIGIETETDRIPFVARSSEIRMDAKTVMHCSVLKIWEEATVTCFKIKYKYYIWVSHTNHQWNEPFPYYRPMSDIWWTLDDNCTYRVSDIKFLLFSSLL